MDSIYVNNISKELELTATQQEVVQLALKAELSQRKALTQEGLAESAIASELKSTTASAVDVIRAALGDKTDTFLNLVKEYNRDRDWAVKAEEHYVVDENKPLRALESLIEGPEDLSMGMPLPPTTRKRYSLCGFKP